MERDKFNGKYHSSREKGNAEVSFLCRTGVSSFCATSSELSTKSLCLEVHQRNIIDEAIHFYEKGAS